MSDNNDQIDIKMILLGESGVGKTSIISRYVNDKFNENFISSSTMSYVAKIIEKNNKKIKLNIWDTIGQEKFRSISKLFLNDTKIVILVYDITSEETFKNLDYWLQLYKDILGEGIIVGVAANKSDLFLNQEVSDDLGREYAEKNGAIFSLVSAKENKLGLDKFINQLVDAYLSKEKLIIISKDKNTIKLNNKNDLNDKSNSGGCCSGGSKKIKQKNYEYIVKNKKGCINCVFLGEKGVGKTSIIKRIEGKEVNKNEEHTEQNNKIIIDYNNEQMKLKIIINDVDNDKMKTKEFVDIIKESNIFFLIYDVNNKQTLDNIGFWIEVIKRCKEDNNKKENYLLHIIGNKNDMSHEGEIKKEEEKQIIPSNENDNKKYIDEGRDFSNNNKGMFKIVSAWENKGIDNILGQSIESYLSLK